MVKEKRKREVWWEVRIVPDDVRASDKLLFSGHKFVKRSVWDKMDAKNRVYSVLQKERGNRRRRIGKFNKKLFFNLYLKFWFWRMEQSGYI